MTLLSDHGQPEVYGTTEFDAWPLIPQEVSNQIIDGVTEASAALTMFNRLPNMGSRTQRMPVLDTLGNAGFICDTVDDNLDVGADQQIDQERMNAITGEPFGDGKPGYVPNTDFGPLKPTHQMKWTNVYIIAEPISIILPIPDDVLDDSDYDLWAAMRPRIIEAFHQKIDSAVIWGQGRPVTWPTGVVPTAVARGQVIAEGTGVDLGEDISNLMSILEQQAYDPTGFMAGPSIKASLRNMRDANGFPIFVPGLQAVADQIWGVPISYVKNNTFVPGVSRLIAGKMDEAQYSIRSDMSWKLFTESVISDENGNVILNLMQQDAKAMRVVMRLGWAVPNPIHKLRPTRGGYPFAILTQGVH